MRNLRTRPAVDSPIPWALPLLVAGCVAGAIVVVGGTESYEVLAFAAISAAVFGDLVRRAARDPTRRSRDATDALSAAAFFVILLAAAYDRGRLRTASSWDSLILRSLGVTVIVAGAALRWHATRALGSNFSIRLGVREEHQLVEAGPYRWIRHPNYTALLLIAIGTTLAWASPLALAATLLVWLPILCMRMSREERMLSERFGARYRDYMRRTWRLLVGIY